MSISENSPDVRLARKFLGFEGPPQQLDNFLQANPAAAARMGKYRQAMMNMSGMRVGAQAGTAGTSLEDFQKMQKKVKQLLLKARNQVIQDHGQPAITSQLYGKQISHYKSINKEIRLIADEVNEAIKAILEGEDPEIPIRLYHPALENEVNFLHIMYKALALYRFYAYIEV